jgi:hypothetical protein
MFRSTTIIRELVLNLAKVIFVLKHSVKLRQVQYKLPDDGRRPKHVGAIFFVYSIVSSKPFQV